MARADFTYGQGYFTSSILDGASQVNGIYTTNSDNEVITIFPKEILDANISSLTIYAYSTPLRVLPNSQTTHGFIYIPANTAKNIQAGGITNIKLLNVAGTQIYFEATYN